MNNLNPPVIPWMQEVAHLLDTAASQCHEVLQMTDSFPALTLDNAYSVQDLVLQKRFERGEKQIGFKMGLTSKAKMKQMGVHFPIRGVLTDRMQAHSQIKVNSFIHPKVEPEIVFWTKKEIKGELSPEEALQACESVGVAIEIIDSRYKDFQFTLADVIADNCSSSAFLLGPKHAVNNLESLSNLGVVLEKNQEPIQFGSSNAIYGHPAASLAELSKMLSLENKTIPAGSVILAGAATAAIPIQRNDLIRVEVQNLGGVDLQVG